MGLDCDKGFVIFNEWRGLQWLECRLNLGERNGIA